MTRTLVVTGAGGFLGGHLVREGLRRGYAVRALLRPAAPLEGLAGLGVEVVRGDLLDPGTAPALLEGLDPSVTTVVHAAGIVSIETELRPLLRDVNVGGTARVIDACKRAGVRRLVYVSSIYAIPDQHESAASPPESEQFDPHRVDFAFARTNAEASQIVLNTAFELDVVLAQPAGLIGPGAEGSSAMSITNGVIAELIGRRLPFYLDGRLDVVDVRDAAAGILSAAEHGRRGSSYLFAGHRIATRDLVAAVCRMAGVPLFRRRVPLWLARALAPIAEARSVRAGRPPTLTPSSVKLLRGLTTYSDTRSREELGFAPRPAADSLRDTVLWLRQRGQPAAIPGLAHR